MVYNSTNYTMDNILFVRLSVAKDTRSLILSCESYHGRRQGSDGDDALTATTAKQQSTDMRRQLRRTAATDERRRTSNNGTTGEQRQRRSAADDEGSCLCLDRTTEED